MKFLLTALAYSFIQSFGVFFKDRENCAQQTDPAPHEGVYFRVTSLLFLGALLYLHVFRSVLRHSTLHVHCIKAWNHFLSYWQINHRSLSKQGTLNESLPDSYGLLNSSLLRTGLQSHPQLALTVGRLTTVFSYPGFQLYPTARSSPDIPLTFMPSGHLCTLSFGHSICSLTSTGQVLFTFPIQSLLRSCLNPATGTCSVTPSTFLQHLPFLSCFSYNWFG